MNSWTTMTTPPTHRSLYSIIYNVSSLCFFADRSIKKQLLYKLGVFAHICQKQSMLGADRNSSWQLCQWFIVQCGRMGPCVWPVCDCSPEVVILKYRLMMLVLFCSEAFGLGPGNVRFNSPGSQLMVQKWKTLFFFKQSSCRGFVIISLYAT